ncbi:zinc finger CCCH domain-containing protein 13 [Platysternon megacephalum]|uniref:Zinc finger CCCH domain-containing protein 13 n=1 Tax=Platysternon megacephalum TaxID=55544 RepID=A0A4D9EJV5_9SAUR|nr:zinc finger CCCH domain-containing protein 13 [Platysternon megacephalum]
MSRPGDNMNSNRRYELHSNFENIDYFAKYDSFKISGASEKTQALVWQPCRFCRFISTVLLKHRNTNVAEPEVLHNGLIYFVQHFTLPCRV